MIIELTGENKKQIEEIALLRYELMSEEYGDVLEKKRRNNK